MPFYRPFLRLSALNILSNLMVPLAALVDVAFLGHLSEIRYLAGVAIATVLFEYIYWTFGFLRMATTGLTAQAVGRRNEPDLWLILLRHGGLAIAIGLVILGLQYPLQRVGFTLLSASPDVKQAGLAYFHTMVWGAPATLLNYVLLGWFLGRGMGFPVLMMTLAANVANVSLNYLLIVQWGWASAGAGLGTALSQYAMLLVGLAIALPQRPSLKLLRTLWPQMFDPSALRAIATLSSDIAIRTFALVTTFAIFTNLSSLLGAETLATNTLLMRVFTLAAYFIDGVAFATETYAGQFHGQGDRYQLKTLLGFAGGLSIGLGVAFALVLVLASHPLFSLLTNHEALIANVQRYVGWMVPVLALGAIAFLLDGYFLGLTAGSILRTSAVIAVLIGFVPVAIAAWYVQSAHLLWLALTSFMLARSLTLGLQLPKTWPIRP